MPLPGWRCNPPERKSARLRNRSPLLMPGTSPKIGGLAFKMGRDLRPDASDVLDAGLLYPRESARMSAAFALSPKLIATDSCRTHLTSL
jgi:hypothetical protein